ncbi:MAG: hypothetical protein KC418_07120 [Anaerolineales bacterium]|nr:hypothetical protein [Anaerolineales bacterium]MCB8954372.1 hypothetical protein [Ardenticatenales bacterium]
MNSQSLTYRSFVLRIWKERGGPSQAASVLRFSLEDAGTNVRHGFQNLDQLISYLQNEQGGQMLSDDAQ